LTDRVANHKFKLKIVNPCEGGDVPVDKGKELQGDQGLAMGTFGLFLR
jgi:hypothetical protein